MKSALIVTYSEKGIEIITDILDTIDCLEVRVSKTCPQARGMIMENDYDIVIINSPVYDETGEIFAVQSISRGVSQVLLIVKKEDYEYISNQVEEYGIVTISKPINKELLESCLKLMKSTNIKLEKYEKENAKLKKQLEDIKLVDRAKFILITHLNMSETEAHKYIERESMNTRKSKRTIAENILKTYDN